MPARRSARRCAVSISKDRKVLPINRNPAFQQRGEEFSVRTVQVDLMAKTVRKLCISANHEIRADHIAALRRGLANERSEIGRQVLQRLLESADVSAKQQMAFCQDTGYAVVFLHVGQDVHFIGGDLNAAIDRGVAEGYRDGYLRASLVRSPIDRRNTGDNTPR
jgi:fumarate hydratase subunit alpha